MMNKVLQINPNKESGGKQPYQQNRIYDISGLAPALCANKSDLIIKTTICISSMQENATISLDKSTPLVAAMGMGGGHTPMIIEKYPNLEIAKGDNNLLLHRKGFKTNTQTFGIDGKCGTLDTAQGGGRNAHTLINSRIRKITPLECERLQTVADNYTNHVSDSQRYKMLGNGWTVDVIAHIFSYLK